jgi:hypothetical protein
MIFTIRGASAPESDVAACLLQEVSNKIATKISSNVLIYKILYFLFLLLYSGTNTIIADAAIEKITMKSISLLYARSM